MEFALLFPLRGRGPAPGLLRGAACGVLGALAAFSSRAAEVPACPRGWIAHWDEPGADRVAPLRLARGSLVDAVAFSAAYLRAAPDEDCVVLTRRRGREILGTAVYTRGGEVRARSASGASVPLPGLESEDINRPDRLRRALEAAGDLTAGGEDSAEPEEPQLERAARAVAFFPSAVGEVAVPAEQADGSVAMRRRRMLALDWGGRHLLWSPATGAVGFELPRDPLTGTPYVCAEFPELLESVRFVAEYRRTHPRERAELLVPDAVYAHSHGLAQAGVALAAYSARQAVWLHTLWGPVPLPGARPEEIAAAPDLAARAFAELQRWRREHAGRRLAAPLRLAGDTPELQLRRALLQLQTTEAREVTVRGQTRLILEWDSRQYVYADNASGHGAGYVGWNPRYLPPLLEGLLFAADYERRCPGEKAVVIAHPPRGRLSYPAGKVNAHVYFTRSGELWGHLAENHAGDYRVVGAGAADLGRPEKLEALCRNDPGLGRMLADFNRRFLAGDYLRPAGGIPPFDPAAFDPAVLRRRLAAAGVPCALAPHRERSEDGQARQYPDSALLFRWGGQLFAYAREKVYRARGLGYAAATPLP